MTPLYTAHASARGGREGVAASSDGKLEVHFGIVSPTRLSTPLGLANLPREFAVIFISPQSHRHADLFEIVQTGGSLGLNLCPAEGWKQQARKNGDDRQDHQQLD